MAQAALVDQNESPKPPHLFWALGEARALFELGSFYTLRTLLGRLRKGDGHPVIVLPGFLASDKSTVPLRGLLKDLNYAPYAWGLGRNLRFTPEREDEILALLDNVYSEHKQKVSIIGWSLGGIIAREIAKADPDKVRSVISLGSPITSNMNYSNASGIYERVNGPMDEATGERVAQLNVPPPVPTTSIFSKTDGVVHWRGCVQANSGVHTDTENIEVPAASHFGMGVNPLVMYLIADRLAQKEGEWTPFDRDGLNGLFFGSAERG